MDRDFLEILWQESGCVYMSDMKLAESREMVLLAMEDMLEQHIPLIKWQEAIAYVFGVDCAQLQSMEDVSRLLQTFHADGQKNA